MTNSPQYCSSGFGVWFRDDIKNALRAVDTANAEVFQVVNTPEIQLYRRGYAAALRSIAEAFGIHYISPVYGEEMPAIIEVMPQ